MEKIHENNSILAWVLCKPEFSSATNTFFIKNTKSNHPSANYWWEYTKYRFKKNAKILSKISTTEENIAISRKNLLFH